MPKKPTQPQDVKTEDIDRVIEKSLYGIDESNGKAFMKLFTFLFLFVIYIWLSVKIETYTVKLMIIIFGLVLLVFLFQETIIPAFGGKKKKLILEP